MSVTPNMNLVLPVPSTTPGPTYATENNTAFDVIDAHDHTSGNGVLIPTAGIYLNADLPLNSFNLTLIRSSRYVNQSATLNLGTDLNMVYVKSGELYYVDAAGNQVQMTASGAVNVSSAGQITGMSGTTAVASYASGSAKFTFVSNTSTPANMEHGPLILGINTTNAYRVTITPPVLSASYTLTLPSANPGATSFITSDVSGNMGYTSQTQGITTAMIADANVTSAKLASSLSVTTLDATTLTQNSKKVVVSNTNAGESLAIVRGAIDSAGNIVTGEGFSVSRSGAIFTITFTTAFLDRPAVTASCYSLYSIASCVPTSSNVVISTYTTSAVLTPDNFNFVAVGQKA